MNSKNHIPKCLQNAKITTYYNDIIYFILIEENRLKEMDNETL